MKKPSRALSLLFAAVAGVVVLVSPKVSWGKAADTIVSRPAASWTAGILESAQEKSFVGCGWDGEEPVAYFRFLEKTSDQGIEFGVDTYLLTFDQINERFGKPDWLDGENEPSLADLLRAKGELEKFAADTPGRNTPAPSSRLKRLEK